MATGRCYSATVGTEALPGASSLLVGRALSTLEKVLANYLG